jgi:hypothetical protein
MRAESAAALHHHGQIAKGTGAQGLSNPIAQFVGIETT